MQRRFLSSLVLDKHILEEFFFFLLECKEHGQYYRAFTAFYSIYSIYIQQINISCNGCKFDYLSNLIENHR